MSWDRIEVRWSAMARRAAGDDRRTDPADPVGPDAAPAESGEVSIAAPSPAAAKPDWPAV